MGRSRTKLAGARVLLTGATGGIGQAIARSLRGRGAELVLTGRRVEVLADLAEELGAATIAADLAVPDDIRRLCAEAGDIDVLVVNHALPASGYLDDLTETDIERAVAINLLAPILLARHAGIAMTARGSGHIVLIGSLSSKAATKGSAMYNATKFGLRGFAHAYRQDLHRTGVGVSIVLPGFVSDAGMFAETGLEPPAGAGMVTPQRVAEGVLAAIDKNRPEVSVAPLGLRAGSTVATVLPGLSAAIQRRVAKDDYMDSFIERQSSKR